MIIIFLREQNMHCILFPIIKLFLLRNGFPCLMDKPLNAEKSIAKNMKVNENSNVEYFKVTTEDNITLDGWMVKPDNFDSTKKYPVVFYVYGEPAASTVGDQFGAQHNFLYQWRYEQGRIFPNFC